MPKVWDRGGDGLEGDLIVNVGVVIVKDWCRNASTAVAK